jgi:mevalonate kinase
MMSENQLTEENYRVVSSAPGKVILFGEHAVVHGVTAIAAALSDLRIFVSMVSKSSLIVKFFNLFN